MRPIRSLSWVLLFSGVGLAVPAAAQKAPAFPVGRASDVAYLLAGGTGPMGYLPGGTPFDIYNLQFQQILSKQILLGGTGSVKLTNLVQTDLTSTYGVRFRGGTAALRPSAIRQRHSWRPRYPMPGRMRHARFNARCGA